MSEGGENGLELFVWKGDWGLPSVDHQCLAAMVSHLSANSGSAQLKSLNKVIA